MTICPTSTATTTMSPPSRSAASFATGSAARRFSSPRFGPDGLKKRQTGHPRGCPVFLAKSYLGSSPQQRCLYGGFVIMTTSLTCSLTPLNEHSPFFAPRLQLLQRTSNIPLPCGVISNRTTLYSDRFNPDTML